MEIRVKRVYEAPGDEDGIRVLVDRLWPRGLSKEKARVDLWVKGLAPSEQLRKRFHKDGDFASFAEDYRNEVNPRALEELLEKTGNGPVTLLYASKNKAENNAQVLKQLLKECASRRLSDAAGGDQNRNQ
ncbi:DUF488 domain-containing protein [Paludifilum halophilum]|uniref:MarR family transcriptional regulator n=1 Tax=Paludifilum halophilum TaxID=1642702 RepID=A0A235B5X8_9BACL|nr:DUF488 family protein [Paludifilum halophilum]OYD07703.1 hypothetical protein CHM34_09510 [Paludifilum halophilum]